MTSLAQQITAGVGPALAGVAGLLSPAWIVVIVVLSLVLKFLVAWGHTPLALARERTRSEQLRERARRRRREGG